MKVLVLAMVSSAFCLSACNRSDMSETTSNEDVTITDNGMDNGAMAATAALPTTAPEFVNAAAASDKFEIESSRLAQASGSSAPVKSFAQHMISAHTASTAKLNATIAGMSPPLVPNETLNADQQALMASLMGKSGAELDVAYAAAQVTAHQKTLAMLNAYANGGDNPKLVGLAKGMIPTVTAHLNSAKGLK
jgi:putative membrane protein